MDENISEKLPRQVRDEASLKLREDLEKSLNTFLQLYSEASSPLEAVREMKNIIKRVVDL